MMHIIPLKHKNIESPRDEVRSRHHHRHPGRRLCQFCQWAPFETLKGGSPGSCGIIHEEDNREVYWIRKASLFDVNKIYYPGNVLNSFFHYFAPSCNRKCLLKRQGICTSAKKKRCEDQGKSCKCQRVPCQWYGWQHAETTDARMIERLQISSFIDILHIAKFVSNPPFQGHSFLCWPTWTPKTTTWLIIFKFQFME